MLKLIHPESSKAGIQTLIFMMLVSLCSRVIRLDVIRLKEISGKEEKRDIIILKYF